MLVDHVCTNLGVAYQDEILKCKTVVRDENQIKHLNFPFKNTGCLF